MVSCSGFGLPLHAQLLRLFVTNHLLGWYLLRPRWVPCLSALAALVAGGVVWHRTNHKTCVWRRVAQGGDEAQRRTCLTSSNGFNTGH